MIRVTTPSGSKTIGSIGIRNIPGDRAIGRGSILTPDGSVVFFKSAAASGPLSVSLSRNITQSAVASATTIGGTTPSVTASANGGVGPYTYAWSLVSDDGPTWTIVSPSAATSAFRHSGVPAGDIRTAIFQCTVTDARGRTGGAVVTAIIRNYGGTFS